MKVSYLRTAAALVIVAALAACGGKAVFPVSGTISGLSNSGLVLANSVNNDSLTVQAGATSFTLPQEISYGTSYNVYVQTPPNHMNCSVLYGADSAGHTTAIAAQVTCVQNTYHLGGTINGLNAAGLVLINGSTTTPLTVANPSTSFLFTDLIPDGSTYGVSVQTQPAGQTCTVSNAVGIMGAADVSNVVVDCVNNPATTQ